MNMIDIPTFLACIAMVETGDAKHPDGNDAAVGRYGERGRYQITMRVWEQHTIMSFNWADHKCESTMVAELHVKLLRERLLAKRADDPYWLAVAWNAGLRAAKADRRTFKEPTHDYATRVANLYHEKTALVAHKRR